MLIMTLVFCCFDTKVVNATQSDNYSSYSTFNWLEKFVTENSARTTGTQGGQQSAEWIVQQMQDMGFSVVKQEFEAEWQKMTDKTLDEAKETFNRII